MFQLIAYISGGNRNNAKEGEVIGRFGIGMRNQDTHFSKTEGSGYA